MLSVDSLELLNELSLFVEESPCLTHLDISGMQMGSRAQELVRKFANSDSLRVVHLNNNMISYEVKKFISNMILTDYGDLKKE
jgi:Ran GTPase-activating protein (RanGAP) involved in mRNA processing and transport